MFLPVSIIVSILAIIIIAINVTNKRMLVNDRVSVAIASPVVDTVESVNILDIVKPELLVCALNFESMVQYANMSHDENLDNQLRKDLQRIEAVKAESLIHLDVNAKDNPNWENVINMNFYRAKVNLLKAFIESATTDAMKAKYVNTLSLAQTYSNRYAKRAKDVRAKLDSN